MLRKTSPFQKTHCSQCNKKIKEHSECFTDDSYKHWWCFECGEKQNREEEERAYQEYLDKTSKGRTAFFGSIALSVGVYLLILGIWERFGLAFLGACATLLFLLFLKKEKTTILGEGSLGIVIAGVVGLYVATTFSIPIFCWVQDVLNVEFLSRAMCSGTLIFPNYMGI